MKDATNDSKKQEPPMVIDGTGSLHIRRRGIMVPQLCPYAVDQLNGQTIRKPCGDWCPLFMLDPANDELHLCHRKYVAHITTEKP